MSTGGGAATNTGIDFQQRLASYLMMHMLLKIDSLRGIGLEGSFEISAISFESSADIDDIVITTESGTLFFQAKRNISLSDKSDSEFQKTINQFVAQHLNEDRSTDRYILATSSGASSKIRLELNKITESIRLNDTDFDKNPLNKSENDVLSKIKTCISRSYKNLSGEKIKDPLLFSILKKTFIVIADIQQGLPLEGAILTLLASHSRVSPDLIWSASITLALSLSSKRQSINRDGLEAKLGHFLREQTPEEKKEIEKDFFNVTLANGDICSGRDVLLIESFIEDFDFLIVELIRFDETGSNKLKYYEDKCEISNGDTWNLLYRAGTFAGAERYIEENESHFKDKKVGILPINTDEDVEKSVFSLAHRELCEENIKNNEEPLMCIHCGDHISENGAPLVEIDEVDTEMELGLIHSSCLRPIDRVIGVIKAKVFDEYNFLKDFDYKTWFNLVQNGQGLFGNLAGKTNQVLFMGWNPEGASEQKGNYCVKINLEDGSSRFAHQRGKVVRESYDSATEKVEIFNNNFAQSKQENDPWCYTSENDAFGKYSTALRMKDDNEECLECLNAEVAKFTLSIKKAYSRFDNYYAPLFLLLEKNTGNQITHRNTIFVMNNPLELEIYTKNWEKAGINIPEYTIEIIKSDQEFDLFLMKSLGNNFQVVANPLLDMNQNPSSGLVFNTLEDLSEMTTGQP